jgi:hypothetical protein
MSSEATEISGSEHSTVESRGNSQATGWKNHLRKLGIAARLGLKQTSRYKLR